MNIEVQDYFYNLFHFANKFNTPISFRYLFMYGKSNNIFDNLLYEKDAYLKAPERFHRFLNF